MAAPELPPKLVADYTELANNYLDRIPVRSHEDIRATELCLRCLLATSRVETDSAELSNRVTSLKELLDHPELYVQHQENYDQYREIIRNRIAATVQAFATMSPQERNTYIENQREQREEAQRGQALLATATPPTGEARVLSQEEWLAEMQQQFAQELPPVVPPLPLVEVEFVTIEQLQGLGPEVLTVIGENIPQILALLQRGAPFDSIVALEPETRRLILEWAQNVITLLGRGVPFDTLIGLEPLPRWQIIYRAPEMARLLDAGMSFDSIIERID